MGHKRRLRLSDVICISCPAFHVAHESHSSVGRDFHKAEPAPCQWSDHVLEKGQGGQQSEEKSYGSIKQERGEQSKETPSRCQRSILSWRIDGSRPVRRLS